MSNGETLTVMHIALMSVSKAVSDLNQLDGYESVKEELRNCASEIATEMKALMDLEEV